MIPTPHRRLRPRFGLLHRIIRLAPHYRREKPPKSARIQVQTRYSSPTDATHWHTRTLGRHLVVSHMTVARVWDCHGLQPHQTRTFKLSRDTQFVEKLSEEMVGMPAPIPATFPANPFFLAESGRKVVRQNHPQADSLGKFPDVTQHYGRLSHWPRFRLWNQRGLIAPLYHSHALSFWRYR